MAEATQTEKGASGAEATQTEKGASGAAAPAAKKPEGATVRLVNTGRGDMQILPGEKGVLLKGSANTLEVPKELADRLRRAYPHVKNIDDIFPDEGGDIGELKKQNLALRERAGALETLLEKTTAAKKAAEDALKNAGPDRAAALEAQVADLQGRLKDFLDASSKKDLDALKEKHADAVSAAA